MSEGIKVIIVIIESYLLGSINSSILVGKLMANIDIREHGSGNAGATNTLRTLGKTAAFFVLIGDILKGILSVIIGNLLFGYTGTLIAGLICVIGHNFPVYFNFKGGKGILTSAAVIFMIDWKVAIIVLVLAILIMAITRYVSLGSIVAAISYFIIILIYNLKSIQYVLFAFCIAALAVYRHKSNIKRLIKGTEAKLKF